MFTLLEEARLINDQTESVARCPLSHDVAKSIRVPTPATQNGLLPPRAGVTGTSAGIQPVLRRWSSSESSRKRFADAATRSCSLVAGEAAAWGLPVQVALAFRRMTSSRSE